MTPRSALPVMVSALLAISCSTTSRSVQFPKSERALGLHDDVRVEAVLYPDPLRPNGNIRVVCEVENRRPEPILIYAIESNPVYDPETHTFTINVGSEIPSPGSKPIRILSAEHRTFERVVSLRFIPPLLQRMSNLLRVRLHFLKDTTDLDESLEELPDVMQWARFKRTVDTNAIPVF